MAESEQNSPLSPSKPFTQQGSSDDEVTLDFGERNLYVSKNFLGMASPVFNAMFSRGFIEEEEMRAQMTGKSYEDFLEFLLCIHPGILKEVNGENMLRIVPLAEEYQVTAFVTKCKTVILTMLEQAEAKARSNGNNTYRLVPLRQCFNFLKLAIALNYEDISESAVNTIARFGYTLYTVTMNSFK